MVNPVPHIEYLTMSIYHVIQDAIECGYGSVNMLQFTSEFTLNNVLYYHPLAEATLLGL
jgi:hypothetical protein